MPRNPLLENIRDGKTSLGLYANSPDMIDLLGHLGFDWVMIDQMWTSTDWAKAEELMRASEAAGITPVLRVQSNPWLGYDHRVAVDVSRALGLGYQFVLVSISGKEEIAECLEVSKDWHRKALTIHPYDSFEDWERVREAQVGETYVIPQPETKDGLDALEQTIATPGVRAVFIAMTDASRILTGSHTPDFYNAALWEYVDRAVELGRKHGVVVGANTSYAYTLEELAKRAALLHEHGVRMIMVQGAPFLFQIVMTKFLGDLRPRLGG